MKKLISVIIAAMLAITTVGILAACGGEQKSVDEQFVQALGKGLEARWAITDSANYKSDQLDQAIQKEKDAISKFKDATFENEELQKYANLYIDAIENSKASDANSTSSYSRFETHRNQRLAALYEINNIIPVEVSSNNQETLKKLLTDGEAAQAAQSIMASANFERQPDDYPGSSWHEYAATVENTSNINYSYFSFTIQLKDAEDVVVETTYASTNDWQAGTKHKFEFSTDKNFVTMKISSCDFSVN